MAQLNYNHLHYFWVVTTAGSIAQAARRLHVTPQTISGQLRTLEARLGSALFQKAGSKLELTEMGHVVRSYTEPMFALGVELRDVLKRNVPRRSSPLAIGVAACVPKLIACRVLARAHGPDSRARLICSESRTEDLVAALVARTIDLAVTDCSIASTASARVESHLLGQSTVAVCCAQDLAERYRPGFPRSLHGAPFVMPASTSSLRDALNSWFRRERICPAVVAEVESPDLTSVGCESHGALFALPATIAGETQRAGRVAVVGQAPIEQQFYAISAERAIGHELIAAIVHGARRQFLEEPPAARNSVASFAGFRDSA